MVSQGQNANDQSDYVHNHAPGLYNPCAPGRFARRCGCAGARTTAAGRGVASRTRRVLQPCQLIGIPQLVTYGVVDRPHAGTIANQQTLSVVHRIERPRGSIYVSGLGVLCHGRPCACEHLADLPLLRSLAAVAIGRWQIHSLVPDVLEFRGVRRTKEFQVRRRDGHLPGAFWGVSVEVGECGDLSLGCNVKNAAGTTQIYGVGDDVCQRVEGSVSRNRTDDAGRVVGVQGVGLHHLLGVRACRLGDETGIVGFGDVSRRVVGAKGEESAFICIFEASVLKTFSVAI